ncbi:hypothetical protein IE4771_CH03017 [Rhizobium etli bv. mimosae str. IE4771]|uniref:Uncharacterized protein n=1 Tax=Rhizobium etli bv. mimosae str. IE4771 TaxID=1432050 RepID=A0A060I951_RHIET|nr:hypothetical protein IE4771_CH03017 [Rhizobium sp. IE4771]
MFFISIGLFLAHAALAAAVLALGGEHPWVLALLLTWYGIAMLGFIAAIWVHHKRSVRRAEPSH